jgi:hypothetical protein
MTISLAGIGSETLLSDLDAAGVEYIRQRPPNGIIINAAGDIIQIIKGISDSIPWASLAAVLVAWLKYRPSRKLIIRLKDDKIIHAEGLSVDELLRLLPNWS